MTVKLFAIRKRPMLVGFGRNFMTLSESVAAKPLTVNRVSFYQVPVCDMLSVCHEVIDRPVPRVSSPHRYRIAAKDLASSSLALTLERPHTGQP